MRKIRNMDPFYFLVDRNAWGILSRKDGALRETETHTHRHRHTHSNTLEPSSGASAQ